MSMLLSRVMSAGTAVYAAYALARPRHLGAALSGDRQRQEGFDVVATTFGLRDLPISAVGLLARSPQTVGAAVGIRIAMDVADAGLLTRCAETDDRRRRVAAVTLGWAGLNTVALVLDSRRRSS